MAELTYDQLSPVGRLAFAHAKQRGEPLPSTRADHWMPPSEDERRRDRLAGRKHRQEPDWHREKREREAAEAEEKARRPKSHPIIDEVYGALDPGDRISFSRRLAAGEVQADVLAELRTANERRKYATTGRLPDREAA